MMGRPHIIVLGNEKGGSGKSTTAMHLVIALMKRGYRVGSIDLDARQGTLSRYIENRRRYAEISRQPHDLPEHRCIEQSWAEARTEARTEERRVLDRAFEGLAGKD